MNISANASLYLDVNRPLKDGTCSVKLMIYYNRKRKYFRTGFHLYEKEFEKILLNKNLGKKNEVKVQLQEIIQKANNTISSLPFFSFNNFKEIFFDQRKISNNVYEHFDIYIEKLEAEKRLKTASSYKSSKNKFKKFRNDLSFGDITKDFLYDFEKWVLNSGLSITTVGIYTRNLRAIYNTQGLPPLVYPFGVKTNKYKIPKGNNIKKALTCDEIKSIKKHQTNGRTYRDRSVDIFLFLYQSGGMYFVDMCNLKWSDISENHIKFKRKKTLGRTSDDREIRLPVTKNTRAIIKKWGVEKEENNFIFPFFNKNMDERKKNSRKESLLKTTNKYLIEISNSEELNKEVTTSYARHTFATTLINNQMSKDIAGYYMGHKPGDVTENYIDRQNTENDKKLVEIFENIFND